MGWLHADSDCEPMAGYTPERLTPEQEAARQRAAEFSAARQAADAAEAERLWREEAVSGDTALEYDPGADRLVSVGAHLATAALYDAAVDAPPAERRVVWRGEDLVVLALRGEAYTLECVRTPLHRRIPT